MNPRSVLDWLREGYPSGVPAKDYIPLIALLRRRLTEAEVREIAAEIAEQVPNGRIEASTDIGVHITKLTDALPSDEELARVEKHLTQFHGWPE
jgi:hypothetical protein